MDGTVMNVRGVDIRVGDLIRVDFQYAQMISSVIYEGIVSEMEYDFPRDEQRFVIEGKTLFTGHFTDNTRMLFGFVVARNIYRVDITVLNKENKTQAEPEQPKKCTCDITDMMRYGCQCGGV